MPSEIYDPIEAESPSFKSSDDTYLGGLCLVQVIRYTSTPVGAYDELAILPGFFRTNGSKEKYARISRIYVSQKDTCYNGRKNWNIPKHLARFKFTGLEEVSEQQVLLSSHVHPGPVKVEIYPYNANHNKPFFTATLSPSRIPLPYLPFSSTWLTSFGVNPPLMQPPLPEGPTPEECGTQEWRRSVAKLSSQKSSVMWCDMSMSRDNDDASMLPFLPGDAGKWWAKWLVALKMEDAILEIGEPEILHDH